MLKVAVTGASGYMGAELLRLLSVHPKVRIAAVTSERLAGERLDKSYPHLRGLSDLVFQDIDPERLAAESDLVFLALPHGQAFVNPAVHLDERGAWEVAMLGTGLGAGERRSGFAHADHRRFLRRRPRLTRRIAARRGGESNLARRRRGDARSVPLEGGEIAVVRRAPDARDRPWPHDRRQDAGFRPASAAEHVADAATAAGEPSEVARERTIVLNRRGDRFELSVEPAGASGRA